MVKRQYFLLSFEYDKHYFQFISQYSGISHLGVFLLSKVLNFSFQKSLTIQITFSTHALYLLCIYAFKTYCHSLFFSSAEYIHPILNTIPASFTFQDVTQLDIIQVLLQHLLLRQKWQTELKWTSQRSDRKVIKGSAIMLVYCQPW